MPSINPFGGAAGDTLPIVDTTAVVKGSADDTKLVRIEADSLTTATTRVITMPDQNIDLTPTTGDFAAATIDIDDVTPTTTKGDIIVEDGTNAIRLAVGANDQVLTADSAQASGVKWAAAGGGAGLVFLSSVTASASATVDLETTFDSTFDAYLIVATDIVMANDGVALRSRMKLGGTYDVGSNYNYHTHRMDSAVATYQATRETASSFFTVVSDIGNAAGEGAQITAILTGVAGTTLTKKMQWNGTSNQSGGTTQSYVGGGNNTATTALTGVRFFGGTGNITSGTFRLYGIVNS